MKKIGMKLFLLALLMMTLLGITYIGTMETSMSQDTATSKPSLDDVYPVMSMYKNGRMYNTMYPYTRSINFLNQDSYTYFQRNELINLILEDIPKRIIDLRYEIINPLNQEVLAKASIKKKNIIQNKDNIRAQILMPSLESSTYPYLLRVSYKGDDNNILYYYQPFYIGNSQIIQDVYDAVNTVHKATFTDDKNTVERMLPNVQRTMDGSLERVDIETKLNQIMWQSYGDILPMSEPQIRITSIDVNDNSYVATASYTAAVRSNYSFEYWDFVETYQLSGTKVMRVENYVREGMRNTDLHDTTLQNIWQEDRNSVDMIEDSQGQNYAIIRDYEIWFFDSKRQVYTKVFGFDNLDGDYIIDNYKQHNMKLMALDASGKLTYLVYGYMNIGQNAGKNGIATYQYNAVNGKNEEIAFIHMPYGLDQLEVMSSTFYVTEDYQSFYFINRGKFYQVKLLDGTTTTVAKDLPYDLTKVYITDNQKGYMWEDSTTRRTNTLINGISIDYNYVMNKVEQRKNLYNHILGISNNQIVVGYYQLSDTLESLDTTMTYLYNEMVVLDYNGKVIKKLKAPIGKFYQDINIREATMTYNLVRKVKTGRGSSARISLQKVTDQKYELDPISPILSIDKVDLSTYVLDERLVKDLRKKRYREPIFHEPEQQSGYEVISGGRYQQGFDTMTEALLSIDEGAHSYILKKDQGAYHILYTGNMGYANQIEGIPVIPQKPELPRGCEVTSLSMLLNVYLDKPVGKMQLADEVKKDLTPFEVKDGLMYFGNVHEGFVGNMGTGIGKGYAVYHEAIIELGERYMPGSIMDITGSTLDHVLYYISEGYPVWVVSPNIYKEVPKASIQQWITPQGAIEISYTQHAVLIIGYDEEYIYFNDPSRNMVLKKSRDAFDAGWKSFGSQAILVYDMP